MKAVTEYPKRQALLLAADCAGIKVHEVEELLWLIQACPTLERLPLALGGLSNALTAANRVWPGLLARLGLDYLLPLCKRLISLLAVTPLPATPLNAPGFLDWLRDGENMDRNPFYAALCELPVKLTPYAYRCWLLAAHVFLAQVALLRSASRPLPWVNKKQSKKQYFPTRANYEACDFVVPWDQIRVPARHAALALRDICGNARWQPSLLRYLGLRLTPKRFTRSGSITVSAPHLSDKDRAWLQDRLDYITNYLQQVYNVKPRHRGHGRKRQQQPPAGANTVNSGAASGPAAGQRTRGRKKGSRGGSAGHPEQGLEDWDRFDVCPDEDDEGDDYDNGDQGDDEDEYEDLTGDRDDEGDSDADVDDDGTADRDPEIESGSDSDAETGSDNGDAESEGSATNRNRVGVGRPRTGRKTGDREHAGGSGNDGYQAIRASKGFAFAMDRLAPCELAPVDVDGRTQAHELLDDLIVRHAADGVDLSSTPDFRRAETLVFLLAGLWSGSTEERTCSMLASTNPNFDGVAPLLCVLDEPLRGANARFRVRVVFPKECAELQSRIGKDRSRIDRVDLPDSAELGPLIWKLSVLKGKVDGNQTSTNQQAQPYRVFDRPLTEYTKEAKALLKPWNRTGRLSLTSIKNTLYGSILSWSGKDIVATTMITGVYKGPARVPMFYSSRRMEVLQKIYADTVAALRHRIRLESDYATSYEAGGGGRRDLDACLEGLRRLKPDSTFVPAPKDSPHVGSRRCPEDHEMQGAVAGLIHELDKPWDLTEEVQFINYTNLYTFYAIWYFGFVTGCRPIATPYLGLAEVSPITLMAGLCDKADEKMRPVWITDGLFEHMQYYSKYVEQTSLYFSTAKPCWFLTQNRRLGEFRKQLIETFVQKYLPGFPANISRRFMMNALWDSGCPPELVRAWAGHATAGNAFWARGATAHYGEIGSALRRYIEPILNYLGFVPMAGKEL